MGTAGVSAGGGGVVWNDPDLANASYDSVSFSPAGNISDIYFKPDGLNLFTNNNFGNDINNYSLSTAWDLSTASFSSSLTVTDPISLTFKPDGTKLYYINNTNDSIYQISLSTAWDLSSAGTAVLGEPVVGTIVRGVLFSSDGTKMYASDFAGKQIEQFNLSTAWDISSPSASSTPTSTFSTSSEATNPFLYGFNPDGTKMWVTDNFTDAIYEYSLSTAWSISSASYSNISFDLSSQDSVPLGGTFKNDGSKMYVVGGTNDDIFQYST